MENRDYVDIDVSIYRRSDGEVLHEISWGFELTPEQRYRIQQGLQGLIDNVRAEILDPIDTQIRQLEIPKEIQE